MKILHMYVEKYIYGVSIWKRSITLNTRSSNIKNNFGVEQLDEFQYV